jgi:hypothetical protein
MTSERGCAAIDIAGAQMGGAKRYVDELDAYLRNADGIDVLGRSSTISAHYLARREREMRPYELRVAVNNVALATGGPSKVALRNALHFLNDSEERDLGNLLSRQVRYETKIIRLLARRADVIVAPSSAMAERIATVAPYLSSKVIVRHHPVSGDKAIGSTKERVGAGQRLLCPVLHAPFKRLERILPMVAQAVRAMRSEPAWSDLELRCTLTDEEMQVSGVRPGDGLVPLGRLSSAHVAQEWAGATAILYPTFIESFGYPLAEANVRRIPILAMGNEWVREIAGDALVPLDQTSPAALRSAIEQSLTTNLSNSIVTKFDRVAYFDNLFRTCR